MPHTSDAPPPAESHNAQYSKTVRTVTVYYPWHPHVGLTLRVLRQQKYGIRVCFVCEGPSGTSCSLPSWMCDPECSSFTLGAPRISVDALLELRHLLDNLHVPSACDTASRISPKEGIDEKVRQDLGQSDKSAFARPGRKPKHPGRETKRTEPSPDGITAPRSPGKLPNVT